MHSIWQRGTSPLSGYGGKINGRVIGSYYHHFAGSSLDRTEDSRSGYKASFQDSRSIIKPAVFNDILDSRYSVYCLLRYRSLI